jgi:hypothetical protein
MPFDSMTNAKITNVTFLDLETSPYGIYELVRIMLCDHPQRQENICRGRGTRKKVQVQDGFYYSVVIALTEYTIPYIHNTIPLIALLSNFKSPVQ